MPPAITIGTEAPNELPECDEVTVVRSRPGTPVSRTTLVVERPWDAPTRQPVRGRIAINDRIPRMRTFLWAWPGMCRFGRGLERPNFVQDSVRISHFLNKRV